MNRPGIYVFHRNDLGGESMVSQSEKLLTSVGPVRSWRDRAFQGVIGGCILFVILTFVAMLFYRGGTAAEPVRYSFFRNFLSQLGITESPAGRANTVSAVLFFTAMTLAGGALGSFFIAFPYLFTRSISGRVLSWIGSVMGVSSAICFVGVAFTPANLFSEAHAVFVIWAFRFFPLAVIPYTLAIFLEKQYPNRYALVFLSFSILLVAYLLLITRGPTPSSEDGRIIQVTGQKIIAFAAVISIFWQARGARTVLRNFQ
jgi:hypothetical protein